MKTLWMVVAVLAASSLMSMAQSVSVNFDKTYDFAKIKTFAVQAGDQGQDPFLRSTSSTL
jgi:hypothetical protein